MNPHSRVHVSIVSVTYTFFFKTGYYAAQAVFKHIVTEVGLRGGAAQSDGSVGVSVGSALILITVGGSGPL